MGYILIVMLMTNNQSSMSMMDFSDKNSCVMAGEMIKQEVNRKTHIFSSAISYKCLKVRGLR